MSLSANRKFEYGAISNGSQTTSSFNAVMLSFEYGAISNGSQTAKYSIKHIQRV